jgi:CubicO group peptidase (beta-lactamase class C family)
MRLILRIAALTLALAALATPLVPAWAAPTAAEVTVDPTAIDRYVEAERSALGIPGLAVGIVRGDQVLYLKGYGVADPSGRAVTPETPFMLGSVSKSFTALAVLQLVEAGKVDLDAPVRRYRPWFSVADPTASAAMTVRNLLYHTSGISRYDGEVAYVADPAASLDSIVRGMSGLALDRPVGASHEYSNLNYEVLGAVVEAASGRSFGEYVRSGIFEPLGMRRSYAALADAQRGGLATGYSYTFGAVVPTGKPYHAGNVPAGYLISSADDMTRYLSMWLGSGPQVVSAAGRSELQRPAVPTAPRGYTQYAMGWYTNPDGSVVWHGGSTLNHHASVKMLVPSATRPDGLGFVVLYNMTDDVLLATSGQGFGLIDGVISLVYGEMPPTTGPLGPVQVLYLLDGAAIASVVLLGLAAARTWRGRGRPATGRRRLLSLVLTVACLLLPIGVLFAVSRSVAWSVVLASIPDYGYLVLIICLGLLALGLVRVGLLFWRPGGYKLDRVRSIPG